MSDSCPFILTKGVRKGEACGGKVSKVELIYCRTHLRNIGVQKELMNKGIDITAPSRPVVTAAPVNQPSGNGQPGVKPVDPKYKPAVIPYPDKKPTKEKVKKETENAFANAFESSLDEKLLSVADDQQLDMDRVYDDMDYDEKYDEELEEELPPERIIEHQQTIIDNQREQLQRAEKRLMGMFTVKQLMFVGLNQSAQIAEAIAPESLEGYQAKVMGSNEVNALLDEMAGDVEAMIGFSDMPAYLRLLFTMGTIASATTVENKLGIKVQRPVEMRAQLRENPGDYEVKDFEAAYKE